MLQETREGTTASITPLEGRGSYETRWKGRRRNCIAIRRQKLAESTMHMRDPGSEKRAQEKELYRL